MGRCVVQRLKGFSRTEEKTLNNFNLRKERKKNKQHAPTRTDFLEEMKAFVASLVTTAAVCSYSFDSDMAAPRSSIVNRPS